MQLVKEGPNIPTELLQKLEDGKLVFFVVRVFLIQLDCQALKN